MSEFSCKFECKKALLVFLPFCESSYARWWNSSKILIETIRITLEQLRYSVKIVKSNLLYNFTNILRFFQYFSTPRKNSIFGLLVGHAQWKITLKKLIQWRVCIVQHNKGQLIRPSCVSDLFCRKVSILKFFSSSEYIFTLYGV